jgi:hypothetical protein
MKTTITLLALAVFALAQSGCSAGASVGNNNQHGASVSAKTKGPNKGVHASVH